MLVLTLDSVRNIGAVTCFACSARPIYVLQRALTLHGVHDTDSTACADSCSDLTLSVRLLVSVTTRRLKMLLVAPGDDHSIELLQEN